jgi:hypothetical protein
LVQMVWPLVRMAWPSVRMAWPSVQMVWPSALKVGSLRGSVRWTLIGLRHRHLYLHLRLYLHLHAVRKSFRKSKVLPEAELNKKKFVLSCVSCLWFQLS